MPKRPKTPREYLETRLFYRPPGGETGRSGTRPLGSSSIHKSSSPSDSFTGRHSLKPEGRRTSSRELMKEGAGKDEQIR
jgi:hypothetical protein